MSFIHRLSFVLILLTALALPTFAVGAESAHELELSLELGVGTHRPDLEDKFFNDRYFGAVFVGGFGFNTDWQNRDFANIMPTVTYRRGRWALEAAFNDIKSSPSYFGYTAASSLTVLDQVQYQGVLRKRRSLLVEYFINPKWKNHFLYVLGGPGSITVETESSVLRAVSIGISASALGISSGNHTEGRAAGLLAGIGYRYKADDKLMFTARWMLGSLNGDWSVREAFAFTFPSVGFRLEDGAYSVRTSHIRLGMEYAHTSQLTFFAALETESAIHGDSDIILVTDTIQSDPATYTRDALLTFGGSSQSEFVSSLRVGARLRLTL